MTSCSFAARDAVHASFAVKQISTSMFCHSNNTCSTVCLVALTEFLAHMQHPADDACLIRPTWKNSKIRTWQHVLNDHAWFHLTHLELICSHLLRPNKLQWHTPSHLRHLIERRPLLKLYVIEVSLLGLIARYDFRCMPPSCTNVMESWFGHTAASR